MLSPTVLILLSVVAVSALSLIGVGFFCVSEQTIRKTLFSFVSLSTGVLFGDVFLHIIPEMAGRGEISGRGALAILSGILVSFSIEKFIHWHHCHILPSKDHFHPVGLMSLVGDALHNFVDGAVIAGSFLVDTRVGVATTLAVMLHEVPHEIGNFALLIFSGFSRKQALLWNGMSALFSIVGALLAILAAGVTQSASAFLLPFAAGNLLYIAGTDLLPELHKDTHAGRAVLQLLFICIGIGIMYAMTLVM